MVAQIREKLAPYFRERANNMQNWIVPLLKEENPAKFPFVIDENGCGAFPSASQWVPVAFHKNPIVLPRRTDALAQYILNIAYCPPISANDPDYTRLEAMVKMLTDQSFGADAEASAPEARRRVVPLIVVNRYRSLDPARNNRFWDYFGSIGPLDGIPYRVIGDLWNIRWLKRPVGCTYNVYKAWLAVHSANPSFAEKIRAIKERGVGKQIPWQKIRELALESDTFRSIETEMRRKAPASTVYLVTMDGDFKNLRTGPRGLFSEYDRIVAAAPHLPDVMTTGYAAAEEESEFHKLGIRIDQAVRSATASVIPLGCYYPEPNTALRLKAGAAYSYRGQGNNMETRRLIQNALAKRHIAPERMVYATSGPLATAIPDRMQTASAEKYREITKKKMGQKQLLDGLCGISQSHANLKQWGDILYVALPIKCEVHLASVQLQRIFKCFHPVYLIKGSAAAKGGNYTTKSFHAFMKLYVDYADYFVANNAQPFLAKGGKREFFEAMQREFQEAKQELAALGLNEEWMGKVVEAARLSGRAIYNIVAEKLV